MPDRTQLPYLIRLLDDESEIVRENVTRELASYGDSLHEELEKLKISPSPQQMKLLRGLLMQQSKRWLKENWKAWMLLEEDKERLERALNLLSDFLSDRTGTNKVSELLDQLTKEYLEASAPRDALTLATYLFRIRALRGAQEDYLNPHSSDVAYAIEERRGIPISLVCIYILVGNRLGFDIEGINFPGHFLARANHNDQMYVVDCFHGGLVLDEQALANLIPNAPISIDKILQLQCQSEVIIARVLRNLINAYRHQNDPDSVRFISELLQMLSADTSDE